MHPKNLSSAYHLLQPLISRMPLKWQVKLASAGRKYFMQQFLNLNPSSTYQPGPELAVQMWGIVFGSSLANSAGMFKNGEAYDLVASLGAGAYLGGTSTANPRQGNNKLGIHLPFISLVKSQAEINFLGLPNYGDEKLAAQSLTKAKISGCPIGWSLMRSPDFTEAAGLQQLIASLWLYHAHPQIDFIEINESCPNIENSGANLLPRLELIASEFLAKRKRHLPLVLKLSNDMGQEALETLLDALVRLGFDGINLGNTSTAYSELLAQIEPSEAALYNYFTTQFGGGLSGRILKNRSLELCAIAAERLAVLKPAHEFHIIRSGGIDCYADVIQSAAHGVSFNQWYSGFFKRYAQVGDQVYRDFFAASTDA